MRIKYRLANDQDIENMAAFWSENSGWDVIDDTEWEKRFVHAPFGRAIVALGFDEETGIMISQFVFIPVDIVVQGKQMKAFRPFAPILQRSLQTKFGIASLLTGRHPLLKMYKIVQEQLAREKVTLIYMLPDPRWSRVLQAFPFLFTHRFPLYTRSMSDQESLTPSASIKVVSIDVFDTAIDDLWYKSSAVYSCSVLRNSKSLSFKTSHGDFKSYIVEENSQAIGFFSFVYKQKDRQWLICDMLCLDKNQILSTIIDAACFTIGQESMSMKDQEESGGKIAILATPAMETILQQQGFQKSDYHFTLAIHLLNEDGINKKDIAPANWYVSAND